MNKLEKLGLKPRPKQRKHLMLDQELTRDFAAWCKANGVSQSEVVESLIRDLIGGSENAPGDAPQKEPQDSTPKVPSEEE